MTLRNQLKNVKILNAETIQSYFRRVSQITEQLEAMDEEVENEKIVMTTWMVSLGYGTPSFKGFVLEES